MSTASTVTTSAEPDLTLGNDVEIANWICMFVATYADDTPLCPTSFQKEDTVVMCKEMGWEHTKGVLWLMDTETVPVQLQDDAHNVVWCSDPIVLCIRSASTKQVRDYIAVRSSHHSGASAQAPDEGMETQPPPSELSRDDGLQMTLAKDIQELDDDQLLEVLEAIQFEMARREGATILHVLALADIWIPMDGGETSMTYGGVGLEGGGDGKLSSPHSSPPVPHVLMQRLAASSACSCLGWGWVPPE